uniref:Peptidase A1 domain-containing protein n=1 Tax=Mycena chlorophos TaxID=658473 RepID=A0ABQ0LEZ3_MYCCL|nr:predicted protein [Mycena chlorophos]
MSSLSLALFCLLASHVTNALPTSRRFSARNARYNDRMRRQDVTGTIGLGDNSDLLYTVPIQLGDTTTVVNLDTGSSDLWVISSNCLQGTCAKSNTTPVPAKSLTLTGANVTMNYGDSTTATFATGPVAQDTIAIAGVAIDNQLFAAISDTTNSVVEFGAAGIFGLGFPSESEIQEAQVTKQFGAQTTTDHFVASTYAAGPLISRIAETGALEMPMFSISLQRQTIDISGNGALTLGSLPAGVDNSSVTWVPVRLYTPAEGGLDPPSFAPKEVYPLRWEIDLDAVFIDGKELAPSTIPATGGVSSTRMSALIDTGNSLLRGPQDVVNNILSSVSTNYDGSNVDSATIACAAAHNLTFQIGGKMFPVDPRDLITPADTNNAQTCVVDAVVATDPPSVGALFRWSLGDPFFKSNLVIFHYGNLTNPSVDPPMIGFLSQVPADAVELLNQAVSSAVADGGNFESSIEIAPTLSAEEQAEVTVVPITASEQAAAETGAKTSPAQAVPTTPAAGAPATAQAPATQAGSPATSSPAAPKSAGVRLSIGLPVWSMVLASVVAAFVW